jgi:hypothetical protein
MFLKSVINAARALPSQASEEEGKAIEFVNLK